MRYPGHIIGCALEKKIIYVFFYSYHTKRVLRIKKVLKMLKNHKGYYLISTSEKNSKNELVYKLYSNTKGITDARLALSSFKPVPSKEAIRVEQKLDKKS